MPFPLLPLLLAGCLVPEGPKPGDSAGDTAVLPDESGGFVRDWDGDGFGDPSVQTEACEPPTSYVQDATDCDDANAEIWPGHAETCDGVDDDCDGAVDEDGVCG